MEPQAEHGPFDIIGDMHGCIDELVELMAKLGYSVRPRAKSTPSPPEGRKLVFRRRLGGSRARQSRYEAVPCTPGLGGQANPRLGRDHAGARERVRRVLHVHCQLQRREKVGTRGAAIDLYRKRKTDALEGRKLPVLRNTRVVTLGELIEDALEFVRSHKSKRDYETKAEIVKKALGSRPAADLTP